MKFLAQIIDKNGKIRIEEIEREATKDIEIEKAMEIEQKKNSLAELTKDFAQVQAGLVVPNIEEKKEEFRNLLNEIRQLQGKEPREIY
ncbi:MAG: hypothetical protein K2K31_01225 [Clostridia bacterium]|nr:hypothetical protein [Clostridia bacterium]